VAFIWDYLNEKKFFNQPERNLILFIVLFQVVDKKYLSGDIFHDHSG